MRGVPDIGDMRRRMIVQSKTLTADGAGGQTTSWAAIPDGNGGKIWADILPVNGKKMVIAGKLTEVNGHEIVTRFRTDIDNSMRLVYGTRIFQIHGVSIIEERRKYLQLSCVEGVGS